MSEEEFKYAVREYNKTMTDLRKRFPRLVNVRPIVLSRKKLKE